MTHLKSRHNENIDVYTSQGCSLNIWSFNKIWALEGIVAEEEYSREKKTSATKKLYRQQGNMLKDNGM